MCFGSLRSRHRVCFGEGNLGILQRPRICGSLAGFRLWAMDCYFWSGSETFPAAFAEPWSVQFGVRPQPTETERLLTMELCSALAAVAAAAAAAAAGAGGRGGRGGGGGGVAVPCFGGSIASVIYGS